MLRKLQMEGGIKWLRTKSKDSILKEHDRGVLVVEIGGEVLLRGVKRKGGV
jgi:hypothetical protein